MSETSGEQASNRSNLPRDARGRFMRVNTLPDAPLHQSVLEKQRDYAQNARNLAEEGNPAKREVVIKNRQMIKDAQKAELARQRETQLALTRQEMENAAASGTTPHAQAPELPQGSDPRIADLMDTVFDTQVRDGAVRSDGTFTAKAPTTSMPSQQGEGQSLRAKLHYLSQEASYASGRGPSRVFSKPQDEGDSPASSQPELTEDTPVSGSRIVRFFRNLRRKAA